MTPHKTAAPLREIMYSAYQQQTISGLAGGAGGATQANHVARATDLHRQFDAGCRQP
jgi:hypothetical protein